MTTVHAQAIGDKALLPRAELERLVELAERCPTDTRRRYVRRYTGWRDGDCRVVRRRHVPAGTVPLIINFTARVRLTQPIFRRTWADLHLQHAPLVGDAAIRRRQGPA